MSSRPVWSTEGVQDYMEKHCLEKHNKTKQNKTKEEEEEESKDRKKGS